MANFCMKCGSPLSEGKCPQCDASAAPRDNVEVCPQCGYMINSNGVCPRCGTVVQKASGNAEKEELCPDCGVPFNANGICPRCGNKSPSLLSPGAPVNIIYSDDYYPEPQEKKKSHIGLILLLLLLIGVIVGGIFLFADRLGEACSSFLPISDEEEAAVSSEIDFETLPTAEEPETEPTEYVPEGDYPPAFAYYNASSVYDKDEHNTSLADDAFDGNKNTCWQDGVSGYGEGETLTAVAYSDQLIYSVTVYNGYQKSTQSSKYYKYNSRVKDFTIYYDGGSESFTLSDTKEPQTFYFSEPIATTTVTFEINSVYKGDKYKDTCITDIIFG